MLEQVERLTSSHSLGLDLVLLRDENEVETKKVAEQSAAYQCKACDRALMCGCVLASVFPKGIYRVHFSPKENS